MTQKKMLLHDVEQNKNTVLSSDVNRDTTVAAHTCF